MATTSGIAWLDQLKPASFRGVAFEVDSVEHSAGDATVLREYPFQDAPRVFTLGESAEEIKIAAYVIGNDYIAKRDALRAALHAVPDEGGILIHPTVGTLRAFVHGKYTVQEEFIDQGGVAKFSITFIRAQARNLLGASAADGEATQLATSELDSIAGNSFVDCFGLSGLSGFGQQAMTKRLDGWVDVLWDSLGLGARVPGLEFLRDGPAGVLLQTVFADLRTNGLALLCEPSSLVDALKSVFKSPKEWPSSSAQTSHMLSAGTHSYSGGANSGVSAVLGSAQQAYLQALQPALHPTTTFTPSSTYESGSILNSTSGVALYGVSTLAPTSTQQVLIDSLTRELDALVQTLALSAAARAIAALELTNVDDAFAVRAMITGVTRTMLDALSTAPDAARHSGAQGRLPTAAKFDAIRSVQRAVLSDVHSRSLDLSRLTLFTPQVWTPVYVMSYNMYGSTDFVDEIMSMNPHIRHPLLCPPGQPLRLVRH